jgi:hypothetical protein
MWWVRPSAVPDEAVAACERLVLSQDERRAAAAGGGAAPAALAAAAALWRERVLTRSLVRCALARYLPWALVDAAGHSATETAAPPRVEAADPASLSFSRNDHGKPHLLLGRASSSSPPLEFNVTHTPELIGVAVCLAGAVHGGGSGVGGAGGSRGGAVAVALGLDAEVADRRSRAGRRVKGRRRSGGEVGGGATSAGSSDEGLTQAEDDDDDDEAAGTSSSSSGNDDDGFRRLAARRFHPLEVQSLEEAAQSAGAEASAAAQAFPSSASSSSSSSASAAAAAKADAASAAARSALFVRLWTLKESVVKARGVGISHPPGLKGFAVELGTGDAELGQHLRELTGGLGGCCVAADAAALPPPPPPAAISLCWQPAEDDGNAESPSSSSSGPPAGDDDKDGAFKLLLMQPCQGHVAALCVHALPADGGGAAGSSRGSSGAGPRVAGAVRRVVSRHAAINAGDGGGQGEQACVLAGTRWW